MIYHSWCHDNTWHWVHTGVCDGTLSSFITKIHSRRRREGELLFDWSKVTKTRPLCAGSMWTQVSCKPVERKQVAIVIRVHFTITYKQR